MTHTILAQLGPDGTPQTIPRGQAATLYRKLIEDAHDVAASLGAEIGTPFPFEVNVAWQTLDVWGPEDYTRHCIKVVDLPDPPPLHQVSTYTLAVGQDGAISASDVTFELNPALCEVSRMQARLALAESGHLAAVENYISTTAPAAVRIKYEDASKWLRSDPLVEQIGELLGLSDPDIDALFVLANTLG